MTSALDALDALLLSMAVLLIFAFILAVCSVSSHTQCALSLPADLLLLLQRRSARVCLLLNF